jgi:hypothetical protein
VVVTDTGIENIVSSNLRVWGDNGVLHVESPVNIIKMVVVYDLSGKVLCGVQAGDCEIEIPGLPRRGIAAVAIGLSDGTTVVEKVLLR